jgi:short-subunit dehydrogenase
MGKLKRLEDQVVVITGASSGIGLATARMAAAQGARLVLAARSEGALRQLTDEITRQGGKAVHVVADVRKREDVRKIARVAEEEFGGFDTWVNNAGISIYGRIEDVDLEDMRRLFETNFWGLVYGSLEAVKRLKRRGGGALINIGSVVSERGVPLQGIYSASKHAVKGFTAALRMELEDEGAPVAVTLVKPGPIDTPFTVNAKNYLGSEPQHVPPVYAPETVARAILHCAETPTRDVFVGGGGKGMAALGHYAPGVADSVMAAVMIPGTHSGRPPRPREQNGLERPSECLAERGNYPGHVATTSAYTQATLHPLLTGAVIVGAGLAIGAMVRGLRNGSPDHEGYRPVARH